MTPFDRCRATPGGVDISIVQRMHLRRRTLTSFDGISVLSTASCRLRQGGKHDEIKRKIARAVATSRPLTVPLLAVLSRGQRWRTGRRGSPCKFVCPPFLVNAPPPQLAVDETKISRDHTRSKSVDVDAFPELRTCMGSPCTDHMASHSALHRTGAITAMTTMPVM